MLDPELVSDALLDFILNTRLDSLFKKNILRNKENYLSLFPQFFWIMEYMKSSMMYEENTTLSYQLRDYKIRFFRPLSRHF